jgi:hypothetical protein
MSRLQSSPICVLFKSLFQCSNPGLYRVVASIPTLSAGVTEMEEVEYERLCHLFTSEELH